MALIIMAVLLFMLGMVIGSIRDTYRIRQVYPQLKHYTFLELVVVDFLSKFSRKLSDKLEEKYFK